MFQTRSLTTGFLVASLGIASGLALLTAPEVSAADKCSADAGKVVAALKAVCDKGGTADAKKAMKKAMDEANKTEKPKLECKSCHGDTTDYSKLTANAKDDFKAKMLPHFGK